MAVIKRNWGHLMVGTMLSLLVSGVVLVGVDWRMPETELRGVGLLLFCSGLGLASRMRIDAIVGKTWAAGERAGHRRRALEAEQQVVELAAVRELARRR